MHNSINTQWKPFRIGDLFDIKIGNVIDGNKADKTGRAPYITRKETNNGLDGFIRADKSLMNLSFPVITIGNETAKPFVQNFPFFTGTKVNILSSKTPTNRWVLQFICVCIELHKNKYSYSYTSNSSRLAKQVILLPSKGDDPDWRFMESYMRQKEQSLLKPIVEQLCKRLIYNEIQGGGNLSTHTWKSFKFNEVFTLIKRGKRLKKADHVDGSTPYVSSTSLNNGVDGFIGNEDSVRVFEGCLTIANSGSVGETFYHQYSFVASDHVTQLKRDGLDKYAYLFMIPIIRRLSEKYSFNREINDDRISREQIILPVTSDGSIDFEFMSSFMKSLEVDILCKTLDHFKSRPSVNKHKLGGGDLETI